ncbi:MAG: hypothetical protein JO352_34235 [Chloroflexi bacterium]|nr:hypothetical protein [Chloroflexota bacterium]MBV9599121.1 hypothetical protein [Chloroflexota bacterium]
MRGRDCARRPGVARPRPKRKSALSKEVEDLSRHLSGSLSGGRLTPSAHAALLALIAALAELLGEAPLTS